MANVTAQPDRSQRSRFDTNLRWQFIANGGQVVLGGAYLLTLGRLLGVSEFGVFSAVSAIVAVAGLLLEFRLQDVLAAELHDIAQRSDRIDAGHRVLDLAFLEMISRFLPGLALISLSSVLARGSHLPPDGPLLIAVGAFGYFASKSMNGVGSGLLRVLGRTDVIAWCLLADWGLRLLVTIAVWKCFSLSAITALWVAAVAGGVCNVALVLLSLKQHSLRVGAISMRGWSIRKAAERIHRSRRLVLSNLGVSISDLMAKDLDIAMIASFLSAEKIGLYKMSKSFVQVMWKAVDPFYSALMPEVQKLWSERRQAELASLLRNTAKKLLGLAALLVCFGYGGAYLFAESMLGSGYAELPALLLLMSVWIVICAPLIWGIPLAVALGRPEIAVLGSLAGSAVGLIAFLFLTPALGLTGAAIAWAITLIVGFAFTAGVATSIARRSNLA